MIKRKSTSSHSHSLHTADMGAEGKAKVKSTSWKVWALLAGVVLCLYAFYPTETSSLTMNASATLPPERFQLLTWNMAAINNNPFEYWITHHDATYNELMEKVSTFINNPGSKDIEVENVFTETMFNELEQSMSDAGWSGLDQVRSRWNSEYKHRKIISEFIKDGLIGKKRLASMPDRYTNTINTVGGPSVMRPTVINCYDGDLSTQELWWHAWRTFMFDTTVTVKSKGQVSTKVIRDMLSPIKKAKYPAITEEEEAISIPLQTLAGAIFDAILVHMMNEVEPTKWQPLRADMCEKLNKRKNDRTVEILETTYKETDIQFLQEVAGQFIEKANSRKLGSSLYDVYFPEGLDSDRDQNSLILLKKGEYENVIEVTQDVNEHYEATSGKLGISAGDLYVVTCVRKKDQMPLLLASFHGDTNGLLTIPVVTAVSNFAKDKFPRHKFLFGMDANTYEDPKSDQQGVLDFAQFYTSHELNSCYGIHPNPKNYTTFHARTYLQPQLNKAITYAEKDQKGDKNPKDFIVFFAKDFLVRWTKKDNTGDRKYIEGMVFPTLSFPSDHGITSTSLALNTGTIPSLLRG